MVSVRREEWQAAFRRHPAWRGLRPREFNEKFLRAAKLFFRSCEVTHGTAEALTLLLWGGPGGRPPVQPATSGSGTGHQCEQFKIKNEKLKNGS